MSYVIYCTHMLTFHTLQSFAGRTIRVFYQCEAARDEAQEMITDVKDYMAFAAMDAMRVLSDEFASEAEQELAMKVSELSKYIFFDTDKLKIDTDFCYKAFNV